MAVNYAGHAREVIKQWEWHLMVMGRIIYVRELAGRYDAVDILLKAHIYKVHA